MTASDLVGTVILGGVVAAILAAVCCCIWLVSLSANGLLEQFLHSDRLFPTV